jgi:hypothetical protein
MNNESEPKLLIYTTLFGRYDKLKDPPSKFENCDFVCFTDQINLKSHIWKLVIVNAVDPIVENRKYKMLPHQFFSEYNFSLYVDASIEININPNYLVQKYLADSEMAVCKHLDRNCAYDEIIATIKTGKCKQADLAIEQYKYYSSNKFPRDFGLYEMGIILRKHNSINVIKMMEEWWLHFNKWAKRDQFSIPFIFWKFKYHPAIIVESPRYSNKFFSISPHISESEKAWYFKIAYFVLYRKHRNAMYFLFATLIETYSKYKKR